MISRYQFNLLEVIAGLRHPPDRLTSEVDIRKADLELIEAAFAASSGAYAPNSELHVGAAIRSQAGTIYTSTNLENAAFNAVHAETGALATARATEGDSFELEAISIVAKNAKGEQQPCSPCGTCRQYLFEFSRT